MVSRELTEWMEKIPQDPKNKQHIRDVSSRININEVFQITEGIVTMDQTPLTWAIQNGYTTVVNELIKMGADIHLTTPDRFTPLLVATYYRKESIVKKLIELGVNVNVTTETGASPLILAVQVMSPFIVNILLQNGANVNIQQEDGATALAVASQYGFTDIVQLLLLAGADPNLALHDGTTPILFAVQTNSLEIVNALIAAHADVNHSSNGISGLYVAIQRNNPNIVKALLVAGANPNVFLHDETTPLFTACRKGNLEIVNMLIEYGANADIVLSNGLTPLIYAIVYGFEEIVGTILNENVNVDAVLQKDGNTALHYAAMKGDVGIVRLLLDVGADRSIHNKDGKTPIEVTSSSKIRQLLDPENIPLWKGFTKKDAEQLQLLFSESANPRGIQYQTNKNGRSFVESIYSHCPVCLKYISHEETTCMYMSHNCTHLGGFYHERLWNQYKHQGINNMGQPSGKEIVSWCTLCGRICKNHKHYALGSHTSPTPQLLPSGAMYESDCSATSGGGGWPEKYARHKRLLECADALNKEVGAITEVNACERLVEAMWDAPLMEPNLPALRGRKEFNTSLNVFENIPNSGNILAGSKHVEIRNNVFQVGDREFQIRNGTLYKNNVIAKPEYQHFYKQYIQWQAEHGQNIQYTGTPPIVHKETPTDYVDPFGAGDNENVVQFRHKMANGVQNNHENPKTDMIGKDMLFAYIQSTITSGERFGLCWKESCTAKIYPQELLSVLEQSVYTTDADREADMKIYETYREEFHKKFRSGQLGGKTRKHKRT